MHPATRRPGISSQKARPGPSYAYRIHTSFDGKACSHSIPCSSSTVNPLDSNTFAKLSTDPIRALIIFPPRAKESAARFSAARRLTTFRWNCATCRACFKMDSSVIDRRVEVGGVRGLMHEGKASNRLPCRRAEGA